MCLFIDHELHTFANCVAIFEKFELRGIPELQISQPLDTDKVGSSFAVRWQSFTQIL